MYVLVVVKIDSTQFDKLSAEEQLAWIKAHMGNYNDHDLAKLVEVKEAIAPAS